MSQTVAGLLALVHLPAILLAGGTVRGVGIPLGTRIPRIERPTAIARAAVGGLAVLLLFALTLGLLTYSRQGELVADDVAADFADERALASALRTIDRATDPHGFLSSLFIRGDEEGPQSHPLATHPLMERRIERLRERARREAARIPVR